MSARENDLLRIQEIYDIATQTIAQLDELRLTREQFVHPSTTQQLLIGEGLTNRVLRAHAYGTVDLHMIWEVLQSDFPKLVEGCVAYCADRDIRLTATWQSAAAEAGEFESSDQPRKA